MRLKVTAGNLAIVLLLGFAAHALVGRALRTTLVREIDGRLLADRELLQRSFRLSALEFLGLVAERSDQRQLRDVFAGLDVDSRRTRAYDAAESTASWLADPARGDRGRPEIAVVVDETGRALARDGARNVMFGESLTAQLPALGPVLKAARPAHDIWVQEQENKLLQTAIVPIRGETGQALGALVVGYDLSNGMAKREALLLGREVAFLVQGKVYSASLEGEAVRLLRAFLFGPQAASTRAVLGGQVGASPIWSVRLGAQEYAGVTAQLPMAPSHPVAVALLGSRSARLAPLAALDVILILTAVAALLVLAYGFSVANIFVRAVERIEEGILAVINGRTDVRLETHSGELGGLAFRINQLLNVMTGTQEQSEDEHGRVSLLSSAGAFTQQNRVAESGPAAAPAANADEPLDDPTLAATLAAEAEESYVRRVYLEYAAAKAALGEDISSVPQERFQQRLSGRATALLHKHGCRMVRFQVETRDEQVLLRPVLIR